MSLRKITAYIHKGSKIAAKIRLSVTKITSAKTKEFLRHCNALSHSQCTHPILIIQYSQSNTLHFSNYVGTHIINIKNKHSICWLTCISSLLFKCFSLLLFSLLITGFYSTGITSLLELNISALSSPPTILTYAIKTVWLCSQQNMFAMGRVGLVFNKVHRISLTWILAATDRRAWQTETLYLHTLSMHLFLK